MTLLAAVAGSLAKGLRIQLPGDISASHEAAEPDIAFASITFKRNGSICDQDGEIGRWNVANIEVVGDRYEVKHTRSSGPTFSRSAAADDTFVALTADRTWFNTREVLGSISTVGVWTLRKVGDAASERTAAGTVTAIVSL